MNWFKTGSREPFFLSNCCLKNCFFLHTNENLLRVQMKGYSTGFLTNVNLFMLCWILRRNDLTLCSWCIFCRTETVLAPLFSIWLPASVTMKSLSGCWRVVRWTLECPLIQALYLFITLLPRGTCPPSDCYWDTAQSKSELVKPLADEFYPHCRHISWMNTRWHACTLKWLSCKCVSGDCVS